MTTSFPVKRRPDDMRALFVSFDGLDRVDGSARFGFGNTRALASVSGPIEARLAQEQPSKATLEVVVRPLAGVPGTEAKLLSSTLRTLLTPSLLLTHNPRTLIQLVVQSLSPPTRTQVTGKGQANYALTAALINASTLSLLNAASIPMRGAVCAVAIGRLRTTHTLILDPRENEFDSLDGGGVFAFMFPGSDGDGEVVWSSWSAVPFLEEDVKRAKEVARISAREVWVKMKDVVWPVGRDRAMKVGIEKMPTGQAMAVDVGDSEKMELS
ncbi:hypothetical protein BD410DRAFT_837619 [Rickenella mellea]|uniref:Exoribonuclease phosphorolytic domain-containing protein n=1 Tax=Rickenella mellea TaxID=50990 RepID=A0A4Y7QDP2_9AGAM|nr:hypothetical protein BD410DRAFT_837619 [Rickenella mellea]